MLSELLYIVSVTLMYSTPLVFGAMGGVISERSGVINIGIEGMMSIGAFTGVAVAYYSGNPWLGFLAAGLSGGIVALLLAVAAVTCKADQTIAGIAINLIGPGLALFMSRKLFDGATQTRPVENKLPHVFGGRLEITIILAFLLVLLLWFVLYKTKWGLRIRAVGEHPSAADTLGINVYKIRYFCVIMSGVFAGLGGASMTLAVVTQFSPTVISGQGFIALAAVIFGKWKPIGAYGACMLFGFAQAVTVILGHNSSVHVPSQIISMLPYVLTIVVIILFVGRSVAPKSDGVPYEKGIR